MKIVEVSLDGKTWSEADRWEDEEVPELWAKLLEVIGPELIKIYRLVDPPAVNSGK